MTVKDRLGDMQLIRGARTSADQEENVEEQKKVALAHEEAESIQDLIHEIRDKSARANELLRIHALKLPKSAEEELDSLFSFTTKNAYKINSKLKAFQNRLIELKKTNTNLTEYRIRKVQFSSLKESFREALEESSKYLEYHKNFRRELLKKTLKVIQKEATEEELEKLLDEKKVDGFTDNILVATQEARLQLIDLEERHVELLKIEKQLEETLDLFIKLATLVEQQQESVDRVEFHAETATAAVEQGTSDLEKGAVKKKKAFKKKIYILLIAIIVLLVIILIVVL